MSFCWRTSLIDALSSYVKRMFINKLLRRNDVTLFSPLCYLYSWVAFIYLIPLQNYWKYLHEIRTRHSELIISQRVLFTVNVQCESKKIPPAVFWIFFPERLRIFNQSFTHLLRDHFYTRLQIFIQLSPILTKLCHTKRDHLANFYISLEL